VSSTSAPSSAVRRAIARAQRGSNLDLPEVVTLLGARGEDLEAVQRAARQIRERALTVQGRPGRITYSPKVFLPLTRLCRDSCHYCTFATDPASLRGAGHAPFLSIDEVVAIAEQGARLGCKEALFTLGDRPESRWQAAREWLSAAGYDSTLDYLRAAAIAVLERTGLLPHLNPGVMSWAELQRLRPVAPSMGLMLETSSQRLFSEPGKAHYGSPDKDPEVRRRVLTDAGRLNIPFTTGVLVGIGETVTELADSLLVLRTESRQFGHIQEVIVQNFRAKPDTALRHATDLPLVDYLAALATARLVLGPQVSLQAPPNLTDASELTALLDCGVDDWGGVSPLTPDHVNPERPWPHRDELTRVTEVQGFELAQRLTAHPRYVRAAQRWLDPRLHPHVQALAQSDGLASPEAQLQGRPWQEPDTYADFARSAGGDNEVAHEPTEEWVSIHGHWPSVAQDAQVHRAPSHATALPAIVRRALRRAETQPASLLDPRNMAEAVALAEADGDALAGLVEIADGMRAHTVGDEVTYVVNRNINFTNVCYTGCRFCAFAQRESDVGAYTLDLAEVAQRVDDAIARGATEICMQGGIHPKLPAAAYLELAAEVASKGVHVHAFSPMEVVNGAMRARVTVREWLLELRAAGVNSIPGTAAEILDDDVRWVLTKGKLPAAEWLSVIEIAHEVGLPSTATMMYGHVDHPHHWIGHFRALRQLQDRTGGFTEFVGLPFVHHNAPLYLAGVARPGPTRRDDVAVTALARVLLHGAIDNIQVSWVKLGPDMCARLLAAGANDLGGTLMEETISQMAGSQFGSSMSPAQLHEIATAAGRPAQQRTTLYQRAGRADGVEILAIDDFYDQGVDDSHTTRV